MSDLYIEGYASRFFERDLNNDVVSKGAFKDSLMRTHAKGIRMLYQHEAKAPIGVWDEIVEDEKGLFVRGRILDLTPQSRMVASLIKASVIDALSIGFRTVKSRPDKANKLRVLNQVELWEVSIVTFPMLTTARLTRHFETANQACNI